MDLAVLDGGGETGEPQPLGAGVDECLFMGVDVTGDQLSLIAHLQGGSKGLAAGSCTGVQHRHTGPGFRRQHCQPGTGVLDVELSLPKGGKVFQVSSAGEGQTVREPGVGLCLRPLGPQGGQYIFQGGPEPVDLGHRRRLTVVRSQKLFRLHRSQGRQEGPHQPFRVAVPDGQIGHQVLHGDGGQPVHVPGHGTKDAVDQPRASGVLAVPLHQVHRLVDSGAHRHPGEKGHLIGPQPQGVEDLVLHPLRLHRGELPDVKVQQHPVLKHAKA